jgi:hypothetical protein
VWSPWSHRSDVDSMQDDQGAVKPGPELAGRRRLTMTGGSGAKDDPHPFTDEAPALGVQLMVAGYTRVCVRCLSLS